MPLATDVNLPKQHTPRFPAKCVVCSEPEPGSTVRVFSGVIGWWTWVFWTWGGVHTVRAPACTSCGWSLHLRRVISLIVTIFIVCLVLWFASSWVNHNVPRILRKWVMMILALLCILPQVLVEIFIPPPFDVTAYSDSVDYEFRDEELAWEFAALNDDAAWVKLG